MITLNSKTQKLEFINRCWKSRASWGVLLLLTIFTLAGCYPATTSVQQQLPPADNGQNRSSAVTQVYFYPKLGQTTQQQSRDHYECYNWAMDQTGFDPSASSIPTEQRVRVVPMPPPGHDTVVMSIAGAVLGALIAGPGHRRPRRFDRWCKWCRYRRHIGYFQAGIRKANGGGLCQSQSGAGSSL